MQGFKKGGTVTAGNASGIDDSAATLVLMTAADEAQRNAPVLGRIAGFATCGVDPATMRIGPALASRDVLAKEGWAPATST